MPHARADQEGEPRSILSSPPPPTTSRTRSETPWMLPTPSKRLSPTSWPTSITNILRQTWIANRHGRKTDVRASFHRTSPRRMNLCTEMRHHNPIRSTITTPTRSTERPLGRNRPRCRIPSTIRAHQAPSSSTERGWQKHRCPPHPHPTHPTVPRGYD